MTLHADAGARQLAIVRIAVFSIWLVLLGSTRLHLFADLPDAFVGPSGILALYPLGALGTSPLTLTVIQLGAMVGCVLCILGVQPFRPIAGATALLLLISDGVMKSIGLYSNHAQWAVLFAAALLALVPAADAYSVNRRQNRASPSGPDSEYRYGAPMFVLAATMSLAYVLIAARRVVDGGIEVFTGDSMLTWSVLRTLEDHHYPWDFGLLMLDQPWLGPVVLSGFAITTLFEILSPLALGNRRFRVAWLWVIAPFHLATLFFMQIFFWENLILLAVLFTPLPYVLPRWLSRGRGGAPVVTARA